MHPSSRYAALSGSSAAGEDVEEFYELTAVPTKPAAARPRVSAAQLFMPRRYSRALNDYLKGKPSTEEDSDSDMLSDSGIERDSLSRMKAGNDSLEMLLKQKKAREAGVLPSSRDGSEDGSGLPDDIEAQPAWMRNPSHSENNILRRRVTIPTIILIMLVVLSAFFAGHKTLQAAPQSRYQGAKKRIALDDYFYGTFWVETKRIDWLAEAGDGVYSYKLPDNSIMLHDLNTNTTKRLVEGSKILNAYGIKLDYSTFSVSPDLRYILFGADRDPVYRWSSRSNFWIHDLEHSTTTPLLPQSSPPKTAIAKWAPKGHSIAFVQENDLYVSTLTSEAGSPSNTSIIRITNNGNETIFNGVPDWVYEEEVFSSDSASWWSPDGTKLAFISFDESEVEVYSYPIYNPGEARPGGLAYPKSMDMRYPKPGTPNPKISLRLFDLTAYRTSFIVSSSTYTLETETPLDEHDRVLTEVAWVGTNDLIIKETNRAASRERVVHFDFSNFASEGLQHGVVTRDVDYSKVDGGWAEPGQRIHSIDAFSSDSSLSGADLPEGYLDIVPNSQGFMHLALFSPPNSDKPIFLSNGSWEIDGEIKGVDLARKLVYFTAANPATERHLYSVPLPTKLMLEAYRLTPGSPISEATNLTDTSSPGFYETSFSPKAGYFLLAQKNGVPWQRVVKADDPDFDYPLSDNANLRQRLSEFAIPRTIYETAYVNDVSINVAVTLPLGFDASGRTKYPVLLRPYGGPGSQTVQQRFRIDWTHYLATEGYIILEIDGRGTGYMGRKFRTCIRDNLGEHEAEDQIAVAEYYRDKYQYIDPKRIGIQGWSYGGYLTAKVIETNSSVISLGMSVAPVTDWRYYDSIYTERYMGTLDVNGGGYEKSSVQKMEGFKHADYLLLHGSGDDNVHYLNSAVLLDRLTWAQVRGFRFRMFTDSAHSMAVRGAFVEVYNEMTNFLFEKFGKAVREKHVAEV